MNKKIAYFALLIAILFIATHVSADTVTIENPLSGVNNFTDLLCKIAGGIGLIIGALGTIAIIISAILYLTSAGSQEKMGKAKTALFAGVIGIFIGVAAPVIVAVAIEILGGSASACS